MNVSAPPEFGGLSVTDNQQWHAPGTTPPPNPYVPPQAAPEHAGQPPVYGTPPQAQYAPQYAPQAQYGAPAGWTPPPKPGLIPLRPMTLGTVLGASFQVLRRNPGPVLGPAIVASIVYVLLISLVTAGIGIWIAGRISSTTDIDDQLAIMAGGYAIGGIALIVPVLLMTVITAVLQGVVVTEVARGTLGEKLRLRGIWRHVRPRIGALIGWALLLSLVVGVVVGVFALIVFGLGALGGAAIGFAIFLGLVGVLGLVVLFYWISTKLAFVPSAIVLERMRIRAAVARSWSLTGGYFWRTLGITLLVATMLGIASQLVSLPAQFLLPLLAGLIAPNGADQTGTIVAVAAIGVLTIVLLAVVTGISLVVQGATASLLYIDLRMRKEGLDLELTRFIEARQAGRTDLPDPYLVAAPVAPAAPAAPAPPAAPVYPTA